MRVVIGSGSWMMYNNFFQLNNLKDETPKNGTPKILAFDWDGLPQSV